MDYDDIVKLYILVRKDIKPSKGKMMVHVGHICSNLVYQGYRDAALQRWMLFDHPIIILSVRSLIHLNNLVKKWDMIHPNRLAIVIPDAGYYELKQGTIVMGGLGLMNKKESKALGLNRLQLYRG